MKNFIKKLIFPLLITFFLAFGSVQALTIYNVSQGGTGVGTITGIIKGNGTSAFTAATDGTDYLSSSTGLKLNQTTPQTTIGRFIFPALTVDTNTLFVDNVNHRLGIGTTSPVETLQVSGTIGAGNNLNTNGGSTVMGELRSYQANPNSLYLSLKTDNGKSGLFRSNAGFFNYYDTSNGNTVLDVPFAGASLLLNTQGTNRVTVLPGGNVGVGTTAPNSKLEVFGSAVNSGNSDIFTINTNNVNTGYYGSLAFRQSSTNVGARITSGNGTSYSGYLAFETSNQVSPGLITTERMRITKDGNVGIGTDSPGTRQLNVTTISGSNNDVTIEANNNSIVGVDYAGRFIATGAGGTTHFGLYATASGATNNYAAIFDQGNVGIGTSAPSTKLEVRGTTVNDSIRSAIGFDIFQVPDPTAPTGVVSSGGSVDDGAHWYGVTYTTALGETHIKFSASQITTTTGNNTVTLTIPVSTDPRVTGRKIYRTRAGHALYQDSLLATITNNTQTTYVDTASDASLPATQGAAYFRMNTTSKAITVNGTQAMSLDSNGTIVGFQAGNVNAIGGRTSIFGKNAGANLTTATDSSLFGENAGTRLTTGNQNNLFGYNAGLYLTTGSSNTSMGHDSLLYAGTSSSNNTTIGYFAGAGVDGSSLYSNNTFIGYNAGRYTTTGNSNTSLGAISLYINSTGSSNVALGYASLYNNTTGGSNIAVGYSSLFSNISGLNNTALGYNSARYIANGTTGRTTGNNGLYLGNETKSSADGTDNEIVIGYNAIGQGSNTAVIGNSSLTALYVSGQVVPVKLGTAPTAIEGGIYYNTTDKHFYGYNGTTWKQLDN